MPGYEKIESMKNGGSWAHFGGKRVGSKGLSASSITKI